MNLLSAKVLVIKVDFCDRYIEKIRLSEIPTSLEELFFYYEVTFEGPFYELIESEPLFDELICNQK